MQTFLTRFFRFHHDEHQYRFCALLPSKLERPIHSRATWTADQQNIMAIRSWVARYISKGDFLLVDLRKTSSNRQLKRRSGSDGYHQQLSALTHRHTAAVSKPKGKQSKRIRHTARPMVFIRVYRPDRKQQYSKRIARCRRTITRRTAAWGERSSKFIPAATTANHPCSAKFERNGP